MKSLALLAALSGFVSIVAFEAGVWALAAPTKALTTILIIAYAWTRGATDQYARAILAGLALSLAGDIFLLWPRSGFMPGLVSFLLAHLAYLFAFSDRLKHGFALAPVAAYGAFTALMLIVLWPKIPDALHAPVAVYVLALAAMAAMAASRATRLRKDAPEMAAGALTAAVGAGLFVVSDTTLAFNKFAGPLPLSAVWTLTTYWLAQWLIASSVRAQAR